MSETPPEIQNEVDGVNTDGRRPHDWPSKYEPKALVHIRIDAIYVGLLLLVTLAGIYLNWCGWLPKMLESQYGSGKLGFERYAYFFLGGLLGGTLFSIKYLYKVVARGYWNLDRRLWRFFSPLLSASLGLVIGALLESGALGISMTIKSGAAYFSYGFLAGYFADRAIDKMSEVAETIFGAPGRKDPSTKSNRH